MMRVYDEMTLPSSADSRRDPQRSGQEGRVSRSILLDARRWIWVVEDDREDA